MTETIVLPFIWWLGCYQGIVDVLANWPHLANTVEWLCYVWERVIDGTLDDLCISREQWLLVGFRPSEMSHRSDIAPSTHIGRTLLSVDDSSSSLPYPSDDNVAHNLSTAASTEHRHLTTGWVTFQWFLQLTIGCVRTWVACEWAVDVLLDLCCTHLGVKYS